MNQGIWSVLALAGAVLAASAVTSAQAPRPSLALPDGYMTKGEGFDPTLLIPPPPREGSPAQADDEARAEEASGLIGTPRWSQARADAEIRPPRAVRAFSCAAGIDLERAPVPHLIALLTRSSGDLARAPGAAKALYKRPRPFMVNQRPSCTPERDAFQRDGSYPSGHAAIGWGWALILSEVMPDHAERLLARGRSFGDSRVICNVHWQSDVEEGRMLGAAIVASLHANADFIRDIEKARIELDSLKQDSLPQPKGCNS